MRERRCALPARQGEGYPDSGYNDHIEISFLPAVQTDAQPAETDPLIAPREGSITSQDAYGAVSMSGSTTMDGSHAAGSGALSASAKERIDKIGREVGG